MRFLLYAKTAGINSGNEQLFYDSESGSREGAVISPKLKIELSKAGSLGFTILPTHPMYDSFCRMKTYVRVMLDDEEIFRGRVLQIDDNLYMERTIQCEGDLSYLLDSVQGPTVVELKPAGADNLHKQDSNYETTTNASIKSQYGPKTRAKLSNASRTVAKTNLDTQIIGDAKIGQYFQNCINTHNQQMANDPQKQFTVGVVNVTPTDTVVDFTSTSYRDTKSAIDSDLLDSYGGFLQTRKVNGVVYIDYRKEPGTDSTQQIKMGVNMVDMTNNQSADDLFTVYVPIGDSELTIATATGALPAGYQKVNGIGIGHTASIQEYGYIYKTESYSGISDPNELMRQAAIYLQNNFKTNKKTLSIKAIDMHMLEGSIDLIHVGSYVTAVSEPHDMSERLCCLSIEYDIQAPENNAYELGDPEETLSHKTKRDKATAAAETSSARHSGSAARKATSELAKAVDDQATAILSNTQDLFKVNARLVQIEANAVEINAEEYVKITAHEINMNAKGSINLTSGGTINMTATDSINFGEAMSITGKVNEESGLPCINLDAELTVTGDVYFWSKAMFGSTYFDGDGQLHFEDGLYGIVFDEPGLANAVQLNGSQVYGNSIIANHMFIGYSYSHTADDPNDLCNAVVSFGQTTSSGGQITIPYTQADGGTGNITFNMADTAWYAQQVAALTPTQVIAYKTGSTVDTGSMVSAEYTLYARNAAGTTLKSATQTISMSYTPPAPDYTGAKITINNPFATNSPTGTALSNTSAMIASHNADFVQFQVKCEDANGNTIQTKNYYIECP